MPENAYNIVMWCFGGLLAVVWIIAIVRTVHKRCAPLKTVKAEVIDKHTVEFFSKYAGNGKHIRYVVTFLAEGKKLSFYVSEFSYGGYRKGEKGKLTYRGDKIVDFP